MKINKNNWQIISSKIIHKNPWYKIQKDKVIMSNGQNGNYFIVKNNGAVFVIPIKDNKIIFVKQYRYVFDDWFLELPGGGVGANEDVYDAVKKELLQETGYKTGKVRKIGRFVPISGVVDETDYVFVAQNLSFVGQELEETEIGMKTVEIEIEKVYKMIDEGEIIDGQTIVALTLAKKYIF